MRADIWVFEKKEVSYGVKNIDGSREEVEQSQSESIPKPHARKLGYVV